MARYFHIRPNFEDVSSRNYPGIDCPYFLVPLAIRDNSSGLFIEYHRPFLWDTGANLCIVDRRFVAKFSLRLHEIDDRVSDDIGGIGGSQSAWLTTMTTGQSPPSGSPAASPARRAPASLAHPVMCSTSSQME